jgi:hypothetical protein
MIEVIDDVLPEDQYQVLNRVLTAHDFMWRWAPGTVDDKIQGTDTPQFVRPIYLNADSPDVNKEENLLSTKYPEFFNIAINALDKSERLFNIPSSFVRIKANLLTPWPDAPHFHPPHVDTDAENGMSCIYYLHDSDGDTFFFGEENMQVTPKANRAVLFDAYHKHCSSNPINNDRRIIVNSVAFVDEEK